MAHIEITASSVLESSHVLFWLIFKSLNCLTTVQDNYLEHVIYGRKIRTTKNCVYSEINECLDLLF